MKSFTHKTNGWFETLRFSQVFSLFALTCCFRFLSYKKSKIEEKETNNQEEKNKENKDKMKKKKKDVAESFDFLFFLTYRFWK